MEAFNLLMVHSWTFTWIILPVLIFAARVIDQSVGTLRMIFLAKGLKNIVPVLAFLESLIWLLAIGQIILHLDNWLCYIAYAGGFAMGNWVGMNLDERLSLGNVIIRIILKKGSKALIAQLKEQNYGLTVVDAEGSTGKVKVIFTIVKRKDAQNVIEVINEFDPHSFFTIEEVRTVHEGVFRPGRRRRLLDMHLGPRKSK